MNKTYYRNPLIDGLSCHFKMRDHVTQCQMRKEFHEIYLLQNEKKLLTG